MSETVEVDIHIPPSNIGRDIAAWLSPYLDKPGRPPHNYGVPGMRVVIGITMSKEDALYMQLRWPEHIDFDIDPRLR